MPSSASSLEAGIGEKIGGILGGATTKALVSEAAATDKVATPAAADIWAASHHVWVVLETDMRSTPASVGVLVESDMAFEYVVLFYELPSGHHNFTIARY